MISSFCQQFCKHCTFEIKGLSFWQAVVHSVCIHVFVDISVQGVWFRQLMSINSNQIGHYPDVHYKILGSFCSMSSVVIDVKCMKPSFISSTLYFRETDRSKFIIFNNCNLFSQVNLLNCSLFSPLILCFSLSVPLPLSVMLDCGWVLHTTTTLKLGKLKVVRRQLLQR